MCKLFVVTGSLRGDNVSAVVNKANSEFKFGQRDGFGFLAAGKTLAWGRYEKPECYPGWESGLIDKITGPKIEIGEMDRKIHTLLVHGRTSTNVKGVEHCHPFENNGVFLVHNGVLDWAGEGQQTKECDSEAFLDWWVTEGSLEDIPKYWAGYGAIFIYDEKTKERILIKDGTANLYIAKRKFDGCVFATSNFDLDSICKASNIALKSNAVPLPKCIITFDDRGNLKEFLEWEGFGKRNYDYRCNISMGMQSYSQGLANSAGTAEALENECWAQ